MVRHGSPRLSMVPSVVEDLVAILFPAILLYDYY